MHQKSAHNCGCRESNYGFQRRFISPAEDKEILGEYKEALEKELAGVEAKLKDIDSK